MRSFDQLLGLLSNIPDPRRAEGKLYKLQHVLLFSNKDESTQQGNRIWNFLDTRVGACPIRTAWILPPAYNHRRPSWISSSPALKD